MAKCKALTGLAVKGLTCRSPNIHGACSPCCCDSGAQPAPHYGSRYHPGWKYFDSERSADTFSFT